MRRTPFYNFLPSKAQEEYETVNNIRPVVTSQLVEARDDGHPWNETNVQWTIVKALTLQDLQTYKVKILASDVSTHICRYWSNEKVRRVQTHGIVNLNLLDLDLRHRIASDLEKNSDGSFHINLSVFSEERALQVGDSILMYYDPVCDALCFTVAPTSPLRAGPAGTSSNTAGGGGVRYY